MKFIVLPAQVGGGAGSKGYRAVIYSVGRLILLEFLSTCTGTIVEIVNSIPSNLTANEHLVIYKLKCIKLLGINSNDPNIIKCV